MLIGEAIGSLVDGHEGFFKGSAIGAATASAVNPAYMKYKMEKNKKLNESETLYELIEESFFNFLFKSKNIIIRLFKKDKQAQEIVKKLFDSETVEYWIENDGYSFYYKNKLFLVTYPTILSKNDWNSYFKQAKFNGNCNYIFDFQDPLNGDFTCIDCNVFNEFLLEFIEFKPKYIGKLFKTKINGCLAIYVNNDFINLNILKQKIKDKLILDKTKSFGFIIVK